MKELTPSTLLAVFEEMFGAGLFWGLVALAAVIAIVAVVVRERQLKAGRFVMAELIGIVGGVAAVWFVQTATSSRLADLGGPIDLIVIIGIWGAGALVTLVAFYAALGLFSRQTDRSAT